MGWGTGPLGCSREWAQQGRRVAGWGWGLHPARLPPPPGQPLWDLTCPGPPRSWSVLRGPFRGWTTGVSTRCPASECNSQHSPLLGGGGKSRPHRYVLPGHPVPRRLRYINIKTAPAPLSKGGLPAPVLTVPTALVHTGVNTAVHARPCVATCTGGPPCPCPWGREPGPLMGSWSREGRSQAHITFQRPGAWTRLPAPRLRFLSQRRGRFQELP